jgi:hypothetical protein
MMKRLARIGLVCLLALALAGCLFDTRDADPPANPGTGCGATPLDDPLGIFQAMTCALETKQDAAYERAISQNFLFSPTQQDSLDQTFQGVAVYDGWDKSVEMDVLRLLLSNAQLLDVSFNPTVKINQTTYVRYEPVNYELRVVNVSAPTDTIVYAGVARFDVRNEGGNWRLTFWDEIDTVPNHSTWGYLKGLLRLQLNP